MGLSIADGWTVNVLCPTTVDELSSSEIGAYGCKVFLKWMFIRNKKFCQFGAKKSMGSFIHPCRDVYIFMVSTKY